MYNLIGLDGNAYSVMGYVRRAMKEQKFTKEEIDEYTNKATSSDYHNLLRVSIEYVELCNERIEVSTGETEINEDKRPMVFSVDD